MKSQLPLVGIFKSELTKTDLRWSNDSDTELLDNFGSINRVVLDPFVCNFSEELTGMDCS